MTGMEQGLNPQRARLVRVEIITNDGITYEVELADCERADLGIEFDNAVVPSDKPWIVREPTGYAEIQLKAFGKIVRSERRQE